ncbi:MAG TPA: M23 family metallopeptidase, partial [Herpetosiphonaceae bacterium]
EVIQGYNCGTHDGWDRFSFDLANSDGRSEGAPVLAAADGEWWHWVEGSGTLILKHEGGFYTMYTHMRSHRELPRGAKVLRGELVGTVGNVGAPQVTPHLHFTLFATANPGGGERQPVPLRFDGAGSFADDGSCNQHGGAILAAPAVPAPSRLAPARPGHYLPPGAARSAAF